MLNKTAIGNFLPVKFLRQTSSNLNYVPVSWGSFGHSTFSQSTQRIHMVPHNFAVSPLIFFNFQRFDEMREMREVSQFSLLQLVRCSAILQSFLFVLQKLAKTWSKSAFTNNDKNIIMAKIDKTSNTRLRKFCKRPARSLYWTDSGWHQNKTRVDKKVQQILF